MSGRFWRIVGGCGRRLRCWRLMDYGYNRAADRWLSEGERSRGVYRPAGKEQR